MGLVVASVWVPFVSPLHSLDSGFRGSICVECQGFSFGWGGGLSYAPAAPHPGGGQAPALHFPFPTPGFRLSPECRIEGPAWLALGINPSATRFCILGGSWVSSPPRQKHSL